MTVTVTSNIEDLYKRLDGRFIPVVLSEEIAKAGQRFKRIVGTIPPATWIHLRDHTRISYDATSAIYSNDAFYADTLEDYNNDVLRTFSDNFGAPLAKVVSGRITDKLK